MADTSVDVASCVRLFNNEISLGSTIPLARRYAKDGFWQIDRLDRRPIAALLAYACDPRGLDPDSCAAVIHKVAGLIGRDDNEVRASLSALPLRAAVSKNDMRLAYRLVRAGVPGSQLASAVRRAKLGLDETPQYCERLTLCDRGVVLGQGTVIAPLVELPGGRVGLKLEDRAEEILALLSVARGAPAHPHTLDRLNNVSNSLQRGDRVLAEIGLALVGQPVLSGPVAAEALAKAAVALSAGADPRALMKAFENPPLVEKASPDDPQHPGWPKGEPNGRGGQFRPKTPDDAPGVGHNNGPPMEEPDSDRQAARRGFFQDIKIGIRRLVAAGIVAGNRAIENAEMAILLAGLMPRVYPYVNAYFDPPKSLEELQEAAQSPSEAGYEDHHIVEQARRIPTAAKMR